MKLTSIAGAATTTRTATLHMLTQTPAGVTPALVRPVAMAPPPRASSFGGTDPRAMFEALVQSFDDDGDGKLSLGEVNALNQGGLLSRNFARIDGNADGRISGDEIATQAPWGARMSPSGDQQRKRGADLHPLLDELKDHLNATLGAESRAVSGNPDGATEFDPAAIAQTLARLDPNTDTLPTDPTTMMESMVLALSKNKDIKTNAIRTNGVQQIYTVR